MNKIEGLIEYSVNSRYNINNSSDESLIISKTGDH